MAGHPRAGGERIAKANMIDSFDGSSPRGRGTAGRRGDGALILRVIPARAGNGTRRRRGRPRRSGHPRAGGERRGSRWRDSGAIGSSPRGRGTGTSLARKARQRRVIPARAGNGPNSPSWDQDKTGHPRAGGERSAMARPTSMFCGSSPRGRGTGPAGNGLGKEARVIPARAGNGTAPAWPARRPPGHPRAGGERLTVEHDATEGRGSSPRGRGTVHHVRPRDQLARVIPARAGNGPGRRCGPIARPGHPRAGGERPRPTSGFAASSGSSPRGRGTAPWTRKARATLRVIPARAGNGQANPCPW